MVIQQASGQSLAALLEHAEHPRASSRILLYAVAGAVVLHLLAGYYVYTQRFSEPATPPEGPVISIRTVTLPKPAEPKPLKTDIPTEALKTHPLDGSLAAIPQPLAAAVFATWAVLIWALRTPLAQK